MPTTTNFGFDYEAPSNVPGITLTGGPIGTNPILAVQVDGALASVNGSVMNNAADIADLQSTIDGMTPIYGRVVLSGTQSLANSATTRINANSVVYQSPTIWDATNFQFIIPVGGDGIYTVSASVCYDSSATGRRSCDINTDAVRLVSELNAAGTTADMRYTACTSARLVAGDVVWFTGFQTSGGALNVNGDTGNITHLAIVRASPLA